MQDAFNRDMFNISDLNVSRYNGHVQVSPCGKTTGGKRDRKGCTKGKIEAIMKNNIVRPKICVATKKAPTLNHIVKNDEPDPYTFTEPEPQVLSGYQPGTSNKKITQVSARPTSMVCQDKLKLDARVVVKPKNLDALAKSKVQSDVAKKVKKKKDTPKKSDTNEILKTNPNLVRIPPKRLARKSIWKKERNAKHEILERIHRIKSNLNSYSKDLFPLGIEISDSDSDDMEENQPVFERYWFSKDESLDVSRESRVNLQRSQFRRRLSQTLKGLKYSEDPNPQYFSAVIAAAKRLPNTTASLLNPGLVKSSKVTKNVNYLTAGEKCSYPEGCHYQALPCTRHCKHHILSNVDQRLFTHCMAMDVDNTLCNRPSFNLKHESPLCDLHHKHHETRNYLDGKPSKKSGKKNRLLGISRNGKRNNKKRKKIVNDLSLSTTNMPDINVHEPIVSFPIEPLPMLDHTVPHIVHTGVSDIVEEVPEEVLEIASLDPVELANQATRLLEEHDLNNVLNQLETDAFNDIFIDKNGEYEPTREETEELERALEAVNNDVQSLERMTRALPPLLNINIPLDNILLDDAGPAPFSTFQNGFAPTPATTDIHQS